MATHPTSTSHPHSPAWHSRPIDAVESELNTRLEQGLTTEEAHKRIQELGYNELRESPPTPLWKRVVEQLSEFVVIILIVASIISALLGEWVDAIAIMAIVVLNTIIGVVQESQAEASLAALKKMAAPNANVVRNGLRQVIPSRELVPGDVVVLEAGNYIPADVRLIETVNLKIEEAALTGESVPVEKSARARLEADIPLGDRINTAFMGTLVTYGRGSGVVVGTGMKTQMGMIATMLQSVDTEPTPLQERLEELGKQLGTGALIICGLVFAVAVYNNTDLPMLFAADGGLGAYFQKFSAELTELFLVAVSLAIAAVPEGLPAVVTITLAIGMREMVKRHALIRRLAAVETLGSASVICTDKTGTLTQNAMTVTKLWADDRVFIVSGEGYDPKGEFKLNDQPANMMQYPGALSALWAGVLASDAYIEPAGTDGGLQAFRMIGDPTEGAIIVAAAKVNALREELQKAYPRLDEVPFDSERKRMSVVCDVVSPGRGDASPFTDSVEKDGDIYVIATKGAPDVVLSLCTQYQRMDDTAIPLTDNLRQRILAANAGMAKEALRVIGVAYRPVKERPTDITPEGLEKDFIFLGLFGMIDPARPEVKPAIARARAAGIRSIMITGDYPDTAEAIGKSIGLLLPGRKVMSGAEIDAIDDAQLVTALKETDVFARVSPQHKMRIVDALRQSGAVTAMTGDGVNDAPAIKRADIGVAMGITGTDVAKETADMVLTDDNYASIVSAVEQGRIIYANIRKFVFFLLSSNVAEILIIFLATLVGLPSPLTAIQLLWLNLVTDGAPALALAMEKGDPDVMDYPPRPKTEPIVNGSMRTGIVVQGIAQTFATLSALIIGLYWSMEALNMIPAGANPLFFILQFDWESLTHTQMEEIVRVGETMAFVTLSVAELLRAFTVRSERLSVFTIGLFSNKYMLGAVGLSFVLLLAVVFVPFLQPVFDTHALTLNEWFVVFGLALLPAVSEEITKWWLRRKA